MKNCFDVAFWIIFGGGLLLTLWFMGATLAEYIRERHIWPRPGPAPPSPAGGTSKSPSDDSWSLASMSSGDTSSGFDASSGDMGSSDISGGGDSTGGGDFSPGGGDFGGGGSGGGWND